EEGTLLWPEINAACISRAQRIRLDLVYASLVYIRQIAITQSEDCIQVHGGPTLGKDTGNDTFCGSMCEHRTGDLEDRFCCRPLSHADQYDAIADRHDIAT